MPDPVNLEKAELRELDDHGQLTSDKSNWVKVQFNPETLRISYSNAVTPPSTPPTKPAPAEGQSGNSALQFTGRGATKLSVQLWFDVTALGAAGSGTSGVGGGAEGGAAVDDVQQITEKVVYFVTPQKATNKSPSVSFVWGSFKFDGIMESLDQSLEYFDPCGKPLRASLSIGLSRQEVISTYNPTSEGKAGSSDASTPGTKPMTRVKSGDTLPGLFARKGLGSDWQSIAELHNIENARQLVPGQLIDLSAAAIEKAKSMKNAL
jgi:hypothetical protein